MGGGGSEALLRVSIGLKTMDIAYVPDLPGCVTTGKTLEEIERNIREAVELHLEGMLEDGEPIPEPSTSVSFVELKVA